MIDREAIDDEDDVRQRWRSSPEFQRTQVKRALLWMAIEAASLVVVFVLPVSWGPALLLAMGVALCVQLEAHRMLARLLRADLDVIESHAALVDVMRRNGLARPRVVREDA